MVQGRLKGRVMRWSRPVAEAMIALRVVDANARWRPTWAQVGTHQRAAHQVRTATARRARPPKPKLVQNGKPTSDHPWRAFRLTRSPRFPHPM